MKRVRKCRYCHERPEVGRSGYCDRHGGREHSKFSISVRRLVKPWRSNDGQDNYSEESSP